MNLESWTFILVGFSIISSMKESMYNREGARKLALFYGVISFLAMLVAVYLVWHRSF